MQRNHNFAKTHYLAMALFVLTAPFYQSTDTTAAAPTEAQEKLTSCINACTLELNPAGVNEARTGILWCTTNVFVNAKLWWGCATREVVDQIIEHTSLTCMRTCAAHATFGN